MFPEDLWNWSHPRGQNPMHHRYSQNTCIPHKICETEAKTEKELTIWYEWSTIKLTSIRLFRCQCRSCSCWVRLGVGEGADMYWPIDLCMSFELSWPETFSCKAGRLLQSRGLQRPKSDSFMCPCLSSSKLSGFMSLQKMIKGIISLLMIKSWNHTIISFLPPTTWTYFHTYQEFLNMWDLMQHKNNLEITLK